MSVAVQILLVLLAAIALLAMVATVLTVIHDGRGHVPSEESERPWTAGELPSQPYSTLGW